MARLVLAFIVALLAAACASPGGAPPPATSVESASPAPTPRGPDFPAGTPPPVSVVPQAVLDQMLEQASVLSSLPVSELTVVSAEAVTWPDGSLGCPEPGMFYTQALVEGYRVVIGAGELTYDFRGSANTFRLCENAGGDGAPKPTIEIPPPIY